jgi:hypothetical protein
MPKCQHCPVTRGGVACVGESAAIFCAWAASGDAQKVRHVLARSEMGVPLAERPAPAPPSLLRKAVNLGRAMIDHAASGFATAGEATAARRLALCGSCEVFSASNRTCNACGCFVDVKARMASSSCPLGKWSGDGQ